MKERKKKLSKTSYLPEGTQSGTMFCEYTYQLAL